jgi:hypothetical protein
MRCLLWGAAYGLCLVLGATGLARGSELGGGPVTNARALPARATPGAPSIAEITKPAPTCGKHGTSIEFVATPSEAAQQAKKEGKLVFVLHVSGHFEDPRFT